MTVLDRERWQRVSPHLDHALALTTRHRHVWLASLREDDPVAADDVEALLEEHRVLSREGFLDHGGPMLRAPLPLEGTIVGAYRLVRPLGRGGMGSVWLAARNDGRFEGFAAVKLLNIELVGRTAGERFKREGTILARLSHPNIARLIDAGVSSTGQPYLVLEHVDGRHIDRHCDGRALGVKSRVRLFLDVLAAVALAHANLIVHRDLKPSNVLVGEGGQVKLLDFGIAKLLEKDPARHEPTLTRDAGAGLTPRYAAPEQVSGGAITTATDVYSLGVLLYVMLTGHDPVGDAGGSTVQMVKAIVDTEARPMSAMVAGDGGDAQEAAHRATLRATTPDRLRRALRGDLDTIVAKALKKDPAERYASVGAFADDLRRYLDHQPITARPDSLTYRTVKFTRRYRRSLAWAAAVAVLVGATTAFYTAKLAHERDHSAREAAKASRVSEMLTGLLTSADPYRTPDAQEPTVRSMLDLGAQRVSRDLAGEPELQAQMFTVIGRVYQRLGLNAKARPLLEQALALGRGAAGSDPVRVAQSLNDLGVVRRSLGDLEAAQALLEESLAIRRRLLGNENKDVAVTLVELARVLKDRGFNRQAEPHILEALAIRRKIFGDEHRETATSKNELALSLWEQGNLDAAEILFRENLATTTRVLGPDHTSVGTSKGNLALVLNARGQHAAAEQLLRDAVVIQRNTVGTAHPDYAATLAKLANVLGDQGRLDEAQPLLEQAIAVVRPIFRPDHPRLTAMVVSLARIEIARNHADRAEPMLRDALAARQRLYPADDWRIAQVQSLLGGALTRQRRYAAAEPLLLDAAKILKPGAGPQGREAQDNAARLAVLYEHIIPATR